MSCLCYLQSPALEFKMDVIVLVLSFLGALVGGTLHSYFKKKGENLATRQDVEEITRKIEAVKTDFEQRLKINSFRYEKEFVVLVELNEAVFKFRDFAKEYGTIALDYKKSNVSGEKYKFQHDYMESYAMLHDIAERYRPFYSEKIYNLIVELEGVAKSCATCAILTSTASVERQDEFWDKAEAASKTVVKKSEEIVVEIRARVREWEQFAG